MRSDAIKKVKKLEKMMKIVIKQIAEWLCVALCGFMIINLVCFAYDRKPGWLDTPNGVARAVWEPNSIIVHGKEGFSIVKVDNNGFLNPNKELADHFVLILGASHTQGKEMSPNKKYSVLVNDYLADDDLLHTYNISSDGNFLPSQIENFKAAMEAFPNAEVVTVEIFGTDFSVEEIKKSLDQHDFNPMDTAEGFRNMSFAGKIKVLIKDCFPIIPKISDNIKTAKQATQKGEPYQVDRDAYAKVINEALELMRSETDKPIVFVYHPSVKINEDATISIEYSKTWDLFEEACEKNGIDVIDSGDDFLAYYAEHQKVPYGFSNTSLCTGHLNEVGHEIIAQEIIDYLEALK